MDWQEIAVALVGAVLVWIIVRRLLCRARGDASGGCASCARECPLRELHRHGKGRS
ncbi:hypothetical protein [Alistipes sp.]|uniref:hypothetical protein n=1 Tax=Alistipes sp. TaxID=1872444 RepID=UPI003A84C268